MVFPRPGSGARLVRMRRHVRIVLIAALGAILYAKSWGRGVVDWSRGLVLRRVLGQISALASPLATNEGSLFCAHLRGARALHAPSAARLRRASSATFLQTSLVLGLGTSSQLRQIHEQLR